MNTVHHHQNARRIKLFLVGGIISTPLFYVVALAQVFTRSGFDLRRHAISTLTLGDLGWLQSLSFIVTGLLALLAAVGMRGLLKSGKAGTWGPLLIGIYGIGMVGGGLFRPDPGFGFPAGAPEGMPASMSSEAMMHSIAFFVAFLSLLAACIVFARRFSATGDQGWKTYCIITACLSPLLAIAGMGLSSWPGVMMGIAGLVAFGWVSMIAARLRAEASKI